MRRASADTPGTALALCTAMGRTVAACRGVSGPRSVSPMPAGVVTPVRVDDPTLLLAPLLVPLSVPSTTSDGAPAVAGAQAAVAIAALSDRALGPGSADVRSHETTEGAGSVPSTVSGSELTGSSSDETEHDDTSDAESEPEPALPAESVESVESVGSVGSVKECESESALEGDAEDSVSKSKPDRETDAGVKVRAQSALGSRSGQWFEGVSTFVLPRAKDLGSGAGLGSGGGPGSDSMPPPSSGAGPGCEGVGPEIGCGLASDMRWGLWAALAVQWGRPTG